MVGFNICVKVCLVVKRFNAYEDGARHFLDKIVLRVFRLFHFEGESFEQKVVGVSAWQMSEHVMFKSVHFETAQIRLQKGKDSLFYSK